MEMAGSTRLSYACSCEPKQSEMKSCNFCYEAASSSFLGTV